MMEKTGLKILLLFLMLVAPGLGQTITWTRYSAQREYGTVNVNSNNFSPNGYTWYEAQDACLAAGGDLSSMQNLNNLMYLPKYNDFWTGLNGLNETDKWVLANGTNLPKDYHPDLGFDRNKKCGGFVKNGNNLQWFAENCGNRRRLLRKNSGFICERKRRDSSPKTRPSIDFNYAPCPTGWTAAGERKCFKLFHMPNQREISWKFAEGSCLSLPMNKPNLACPSTRNEMVLLSYEIHNTLYKTRTWFGLRRMTNKDRWIWADNSRMNATYFHHYISQKLDYGYGFIDKATDPAYSWDVSTEQDGVRATTISYACQIERPRI